MAAKNDIFDDFLKGTLGDLEGSVSSADWDAIAGSLDALETKKRRPLVWWLLAGSIVIGFGLIFMQWMKPANAPSTGSAEIAEQTEQPTTSIIEQRETSTNPIGTKETAEIVDVNEGVSAHPENAIVEIPVSVVNKPVSNTSNNASDFGNERIYVEYTPIILDYKPLPSWVELVPAHLDPAILLASVIDANKFFNKIPTINKGLQKAPMSLMNKGSWELGLSASPSLASKLVKESKNFGGLLNRQYNSIIDKGESAGASYQLGFSVTKFVMDRFYISTGIQYDQLGESVDYKYSITDFPVINYTERRIVDYAPLAPVLHEHVQYNGHNTYHFLEIPLKFGIVVPIVGNRFHIRSEVGVQYVHLTGASGKKVDATGLELFALDNWDKVRRQSIGGMVSSGLYTGVGSNIELGFTPYYQVNLNSLREKESAITERPYSYGFNIQLKYRLLGSTK